MPSALYTRIRNAAPGRNALATRDAAGRGPASRILGAPAIAGATHVGVVRRVNQDAFGRFDDPERGSHLLSDERVPVCIQVAASPGR